MQNLRRDRTEPIITIKFTPNSIKYIFYMSILNKILIYIHIRIARHFVVETSEHHHSASNQGTLPKSSDVSQSAYYETRNI